MPEPTEAAMSLLRDRYMQDDEHSWLGICNRVAHNIASQETEEENQIYYEGEFFDILKRMDFIPNSPTLMNAGTDLQFLSACLVLPVEDSIEGIFSAIKEQAQVSKAGAGTGFAFSRLRPKGSLVSSTGEPSSGPIPFMEIFDKNTDAIIQGGRRKGANMAVMRVDHPDITEFINIKYEPDRRNQEILQKLKDNMQLNREQIAKAKRILVESQFTNFNISVGANAKFMEAVEKDGEIELTNPKDGESWGKIPARELWQKIIERAWTNGDPGMVWLDKINEEHPVNERIESVNVCGEVPLLPYESCNLGAINLANFAEKGSFDWSRLEKVIPVAVRFLDNVIDANEYPVPDIEKSTKEYRKIGVGVMGFHEALIRQNIAYDSEEGLEFAEYLFQFINSKAIEASQDLAKEKGKFPGFDNTTIDKPRRNAVLTTVAPTGSRSMIANTSGGIEPFYSMKYKHIDSEGNERMMDYDFTEVADDDVLVTALEIEPEWHVRMQAAAQRYVGSAVSKTVNLPNDATVKDVSDIYKMAYDLGCKGITIYRNGSRAEQVLNDCPECQV